MPEGGYAIINIFRAGVTFLDGTTTKRITEDDLDEYGFARFGYYFPASMSGGSCHYMVVYDADGNEVYQGN
jgi:hypothetical protein